MLLFNKMQLECLHILKKKVAITANEILTTSWVADVCHAFVTAPILDSELRNFKIYI